MDGARSFFRLSSSLLIAEIAAVFRRFAPRRETKFHRDRHPFNRPLGLVSDAPVPDEDLAELVARGIGDDELRAAVAVHDDRVLAKHTTEREGLIAIHRMNQPRRLAPRSLGIVFVADTLLDAITAEHEHVAEDRMARV